MIVRVGINGFGRIGRITFRTCFQNSEIQLAAINDPAIDIEYICYLIKFDSTHGKFRGNITHTDDEIIINGHKIKVFREKFPPDVPWCRAGVQYVIEASGMFTSLDKASGHLASEGVKRVIVTAPSVDIPMVILGVNEYMISTEHRVISCTSSTLYCLAPIIKVLHEHFGVVEGFITSIHAMTPSLKPLDGLCMRGKHWRDHRSINQNIIPATTGACKALAKIIPEVKDKMTGLAFRVPIINVSVLDITIKLETDTSKENIIKSVEKAGRRELRNIIRISNEDAVSSDFIGDSHSCIIDVESSLQLRPDFYKIICWYENEFSYACRVVDAIFYSEMQFAKSNLSRTMSIQAKYPEQIMPPIQISNKMIKCNYTTPPEDEIFYINSNESIKTKPAPKPRPLLVRKPLSQSSSNTGKAQNRDSKNKNDIFKIWNEDYDTTKNSVKQNKSSFFHSCITFGPKPPLEQIDCIKVQERLESVKKEFSKMLVLTEDLLKKSNCSKNKLQSLDAKAMIKGDLTTESKAEYNQDTQKNMNKDYAISKVSNTVVKDSGDFNKKDTVSGINNELNYGNLSATNILSCFTKLDDKRAVYDSTRKTTILENLRITVSKEDNVLQDNTNVVSNSDLLSIVPVHSTETEEPTYIDESDINPQLVAKAIRSLTYAITNKVVENVYNELNAQAPLKSKKSCENTLKSIDFKEANDTININNINEVVNLEGDLPINKEKTEHSYKKYSTKYLRRSSDDMRIMDEELKKRNIILDSGSNMTNRGEPLAVEDNDLKNLDLNTKILAGLRMVTKKGIDNISPCVSMANTVTTISNGDRNRLKDDLYDKLDSASASDSNNSFQINERKSQVLNVTDLTNSLEDLSRLDKICRIIEISDELSDKLFSSLDNTDASLQQKKWSFKDLCERLKLDEFCNNVFGKTSF